MIFRYRTLFYFNNLFSLLIEKKIQPSFRFLLALSLSRSLSPEPDTHVAKILENSVYLLLMLFNSLFLFLLDVVVNFFLCAGFLVISVCNFLVFLFELRSFRKSSFHVSMKNTGKKINNELIDVFFM